jgi:hypothetical protein
MPALLKRPRQNGHRIDVPDEGRRDDRVIPHAGSVSNDAPKVKNVACILANAAKSS